MISQPDDVTICEGRGAVFTCVLNSNIRSDDVQWYRFIKDTSTTEMVDPNGDNFLTCTIGGTTNSSLTITNAIKSYTGYFWVGTSSLHVCNASLTVLTSMYTYISVLDRVNTYNTKCYRFWEFHISNCFMHKHNRFWEFHISNCFMHKHNRRFYQPECYSVNV